MRGTIATELPIATVVVLEDRAQVTRRARLMLDAGHHRLVIEGVSPVICDRTVVARCDDGAEIADWRIVRHAVDAMDPETDPEMRELMVELKALDDAGQKLRQQRRRGQARLTDLSLVAQRRLDDLSVDVGHNRAPAPALARELSGLDARRREQAHAQIDVDTELERLRRATVHLRDRVDRRKQQPSHGLQARAEIDIAVETAGELEVCLDYVVANACWRPHHRVTLDNGQLHFETDGCVWQNTGEAWQGIALSLSTERRSLGVEPPLLDTEELRVHRRPSTMQLESREQVVEDVAVDGAPAASGSQAALAGVDDGGNPQTRRVDGRADIPSDGCPHRVALGSFSAPTAIERVAYPELSEVVHRVAKLDNSGDDALLAGPVDVVLDGGLSGRTQVSFVGVGEAFEVGLGPDRDLRLRRLVEEKIDDQGLLSSWTKTHHKVTIKLSNLGTSTPKVRVRERVPVSEVDKLRIHVDDKRTSDRVGSDGDGFVDWERVLSSRGTASVVLRYTVERHDDVAM
jgi:uncharacterized protein (TIGR02231 family)